MIRPGSVGFGEEARRGQTHSRHMWRVPTDSAMGSRLWSPAKAAALPCGAAPSPTPCRAPRKSRCAHPRVRHGVVSRVVPSSTGWGIRFPWELCPEDPCVFTQSLINRDSSVFESLSYSPVLLYRSCFVHWELFCVVPVLF